MILYNQFDSYSNLFLLKNDLTFRNNKNIELKRFAIHCKVKKLKFKKIEKKILLTNESYTVRNFSVILRRKQPSVVLPDSSPLDYG